jgi:hypothetical protein
MAVNFQVSGKFRLTLRGNRQAGCLRSRRQPRTGNFKVIAN